MDMENMRGKNNQSVAVLRRWRSEGDDTDIPRALYDKGYNYLGSDRFVEDCDFEIPNAGQMDESDRSE